VQTFLPYSDYKQSAQCLDSKRLGKQRVEVWTIYRVITEGKKGWHNHPIVKMWKEYPDALLVYGIAICAEWQNRGYKDTMLARFDTILAGRISMGLSINIKHPRWLGDADFHLSHQSNLVRKNPVYYRKYFPDVPDNLSYVWITE
jgi:hypothetical protein